MERNHLHLYDDLDPLSIFSISNSAGIVTLEVPSSATMTVAGKSTFVGTDTCVITVVLVRLHFNPYAGQPHVP